ncbi:MAG: N-acetyl-lysine deacetylase [Desulfurococcales archaeon]|nr:N-acetyl-lysine deacetylase [Desulfurococcales archaeon]
MGLGSASAGSMAASILYRLVSVYSPSGRELEASKTLAEIAVELGLNAWLDNTNSVYITPEWSDRSAGILLVGHIDTVKGYIEPRFNGELVWGRGAVDAKGPLAAMLTSLSYASTSIREVRCPIALAALTGEEEDSRGAWNLVNTGHVPPLIVVGEPTNDTKVAIGYRGSMKVLIECKGRGGHSSAPWLGDSALDLLYGVISDIKKLETGRGPDGLSIAVTRICGGDSWNVLPSSAEAYIDIRIPPGVNPSTLRGNVLGIAHRPGCNAKIVAAEDPIRVKPSSPVPRSLMRGLLVQGIKPSLAIKTGTSDMNILGKHTHSISAYGPGDSRLAHTTQEHVSVKSLEIAVKTYSHAIKELCNNRIAANTVPLPID